MLLEEQLFLLEGFVASSCTNSLESRFGEACTLPVQPSFTRTFTENGVMAGGSVVASRISSEQTGQVVLLPLGNFLI